MARTPLQEGPDAHTQLDRRLRRELQCTVTRTERSTWTTSSNLPHEIQIHEEAGVELVRVSAGMVVGVKPKKALLKQVNHLNAVRAFTRRIVGDGKVIIVAEMPLASLRKGDLEQLISMVHCLARLDAHLLAAYGGQSVTDLPALAPDVDRQVENWKDLLEASGTATIKELQVWLDLWADCECWIDRDGNSVVVVLGTDGRATEYPFPLGELRDDVKCLQEQQREEEEREEQEEDDAEEEGDEVEQAEAEDEQVDEVNAPDPGRIGAPAIRPPAQRAATTVQINADLLFLHVAASAC